MNQQLSGRRDQEHSAASSQIYPSVQIDRGDAHRPYYTLSIQYPQPVVPNNNMQLGNSLPPVRTTSGSPYLDRGPSDSAQALCSVTHELNYFPDNNILQKNSTTLDRDPFIAENIDINLSRIHKKLATMDEINSKVTELSERVGKLEGLNQKLVEIDVTLKNQQNKNDADTEKLQLKNVQSAKTDDKKSYGSPKVQAKNEKEDSVDVDDLDDSDNGGEDNESNAGKNSRLKQKVTVNDVLDDIPDVDDGEQDNKSATEKNYRRRGTMTVKNKFEENSNGDIVQNPKPKKPKTMKTSLETKAAHDANVANLKSKLLADESKKNRHHSPEQSTLKKIKNKIPYFRNSENKSAKKASGSSNKKKPTMENESEHLARTQQRSNVYGAPGNVSADSDSYKIDVVKITFKKQSSKSKPRDYKLDNLSDDDSDDQSLVQNTKVKTPRPKVAANSHNILDDLSDDESNGDDKSTVNAKSGVNLRQQKPQYARNMHVANNDDDDDQLSGKPTKSKTNIPQLKAPTLQDILDFSDSDDESAAKTKPSAKPAPPPRQNFANNYDSSDSDDEPVAPKPALKPAPKPFNKLANISDDSD